MLSIRTTLHNLIDRLMTTKEKFYVIKEKGKKLYMYFPSGQLEWTDEKKHGQVMRKDYGEHALAVHSTEAKPLELVPA